MQSSTISAKFTICTFTLLAVLSAGCGSSHTTPKSPTPNPNPGSPSSPGTSSATFSVASIVPAAGATNVALNSTIQITFSSAATASTVNTTNIKVTDPSPVSGAVSYNAQNNSATFTPSAPLAASTTYTVTVSGVTGTNGASLASPFKSSFVTVAASSGGGGGGGTGATLQYQAPILPAGGPTMAVYGQVTIDTKGNTTLTLKGAMPNAKLFVEFCPAVEPGAPNATTPCFAIFQTLNTDANGDATATTMFPQSGDWAGDFYVQNEAANSSTVYQTWVAPGVNGETYQSILLPATKTNGSADTTVTTQDPLTSGTVAYSNGSVVFTVTGALASTNYSTSESETTYIDGSGTYQLSTFNTDAKGDGSSNTQLDGIGGDMFQVQVQSGKYAGFIGGFSIPHS